MAMQRAKDETAISNHLFHCGSRKGGRDTDIVRKGRSTIGEEMPEDKTDG